MPFGNLKFKFWLLITVTSGLTLFLFNNCQRNSDRHETNLSATSSLLLDNSPNNEVQNPVGVEVREIEGKLEIVQVDFEDPMQNRKEFALITTTNQRISLQVNKTHDFDHMLSGDLVKVKGVRKIVDGKEELIGAGDNSVSITPVSKPTAATSTRALTTRSILPNTFGEQRTLVLLVNFSDNATQPFTSSQINDLVFNTVNKFYLETSYQQTSIKGEVRGWYTLNLSSSSSRSQIADAADQAAAAEGVILANYNRFIYFFPKIAFGGAAGMASIGGNPSRAWINGSTSLKVVTHELGHNFGLLHSHGINCTGGVITDNCEALEYGDNPDVMGGVPMHFNAFQKERLGWLDYGTSPQLQTVESDGIYTIEPYETASQGLKALKVLRSIDPVTLVKSWYYLEYRQPIGVDGKYIALNPENVFSGILFRMASENAAEDSYLLDLTPDSFDTSIDFFQDLGDPALVMGKTYSDSVNGLTITNEKTDATGVRLKITYGSLPIATPTPTPTPTSTPTSTPNPTPTSNQAPIAKDDSASTSVGTSISINVIANDSDPEGNAISVTAATNPSNGSLKINTNGTITFIPNKRYRGTDSFTYTISDGQLTASAKVTVQVVRSGR